MPTLSVGLTYYRGQGSPKPLSARKGKLALFIFQNLFSVIVMEFLIILIIIAVLFSLFLGLFGVEFYNAFPFGLGFALIAVVIFIVHKLHSWSVERKEKEEEEQRLKEEEERKMEEERIRQEAEKQKLIEEEERKKREWEQKIEEIRKEEEERQKRLEELKRTDFASYMSIKIFEMFYDDKRLTSCPENIETKLINGMLLIDCDMPRKTDVDRVKEIYYTQGGDEREKLYNDRDFAKVYDDTLYSLCLNAIDISCSLDEAGIVENILFNGYISDYSPTTGKFERTLIMSIIANKQQFEEIDIEHVEPKACFKALKGVSAAKLIDVAPITPVIVFDKNDNRFIEGRDIETDSGTNLAAMDWQDFEQLVREVLQLRFEKDGWKVNITRASRDGGVDAIIFNPDPLTGGKILVQAKRYTNTVGVSAVRDLYGAMTDERASKGILITTADFGSDSWNFVKDKPITLLNGGHLLGIMQEIGMKGYIDIQEAKL